MHHVTVPGIGGSDDDHWQSHWERANDNWVRIAPKSWDEPDVDDWAAALEVAVCDTFPVLVAHSLGCLAAVRWTGENPGRVSGLFLVAPPDPRGQVFPAVAAPFGLELTRVLPVPAIVVAGSNDPYCTPDRAREFASTWDVPLIDAGAHGHLNAASDIGEWAEGWNLLTAFEAGSSKKLCRQWKRVKIRAVSLHISCVEAHTTAVGLPAAAWGVDVTSELRR
ncbi:MAG: alpha/beta hydrolase, partial [Rhodococcus sp. (in: high G+C Gram-positive bacteria)]|uniref:RBBP9/YdeN family alpha/beta hydrolase n=1 Tax=Rhodococcus sp. TaxID=1831 RepID=UPI002AD868E2|nr:alpha/beta hydrolase [Rhodococcus sp. (in: high G+C Gram-positive bacteria)]